MLALGAGAQRSVMNRISAMGTNLLVVRPAQRGRAGVMSGTQQNLTIEDAEALLVEVPGILEIAPVVSRDAQVKYYSKNARTNVLGTVITYFGIRTFEFESGSMFTEADVERGARVAVLGPVTAENLFGVQDPIGQAIKLNGTNFHVVGLLRSKGDQGYFNRDDQVVIPITTAMKQVFGVENLREIDIQAKEESDLDNLQAAVGEFFRKRHRVQAEMPDDVSIRNQADVIETASNVGETFTMLLAGIAGISLLVGGIGIMNIMLVTVTERTREIGIRKAIGAKEREIMRQFLVEALLMTGLGGLMGVAIGIGGARAMTLATDRPTLVETQSVMLALGFSAAIGIFFGYYPAQRAARLDPIEALRHE